MRNKFGAIRTTVDGIKFDSKGESRRYEVLRDRQAAGLISNLSTQVSFPLVVEGVKLGSYRADFRYTRDGVEIIEDFKSKATMTAVYRMKKKLMLALHGISIYETFKADDA